MKLSSIMAFAVVAATLSLSSAHASLVTGSFNVSVYQSNVQYSIGDPEVQANDVNPLLAGVALYTGVYTGDINFGAFDQAGNNILAFLLSAGGSLSGDTTALNTTMSTAPFSLTTVFDFTWTASGYTGGDIDHDDGVSLYLNGSEVVDSAYPTSPIETVVPATGAGDYRLIYVAANDVPEVLTFNVDGTVPEPMTIAVWGLLGVCGSAAAWRAKKKQLKA